MNISSMKLYHLKTSTRADRHYESYVSTPPDLFLISFSTIRAAHRRMKKVAAFFSVVVVAAVAVVVAVAVAVVVVAVHYGSKQCDIGWSIKKYSIKVKAQKIEDDLAES